MFKKDDNRDFRPVKSLTMGDPDFNQFMRLRNQLVIAELNFGREENLSPVLILTLSEGMDEQLKLAHKLVDVVNRPYKRFFVNLLQYKVDKPESSYAQVQFLAKKKEELKLQQIVQVKFELEEFMYLLDVMTSVYDKDNTNKLICNVQ